MDQITTGSGCFTLRYFSRRYTSAIQTNGSTTGVTGWMSMACVMYVVSEYLILLSDLKIY